MSERLIVKVGNANAIELLRQADPQNPGQEISVWNAVPGELVTTISLEPNLPFMAQLQQVVRFLQEMMTPGAVPWWFECQDEALRTALCQHYGLNPDRVRPPNWGDGTTINPPDKEAKQKHPGTNEHSDQTPEGNT